MTRLLAVATLAAGLAFFVAVGHPPGDDATHGAAAAICAVAFAAVAAVAISSPPRLTVFYGAVVVAPARRPRGRRRQVPARASPDWLQRFLS